jgi:membrane-associated protease RseP (regulator of RpoE activity)
MEEEKREFASALERRYSFFDKKRLWLNILLFVITSISAFIVGISWSLSYKYADDLTNNSGISSVSQIIKDPQIISLSIIYAAVLLIILLGHELGHYLSCRYYHVSATLPYFIPAPTLIGTLGAFIKIKSPIARKKELFDIGAAGPLAGFILALPALVYGLAHSKVIPSIPREETLIFGEPLLLKFIGSLIFEHIPTGYDIILHPVAFAGWVGVLVTAFNLFPIGQLDGGHVSYAILGSKSKVIARIFLGALFIMGVFFWIGWIVWALLILLIGLKHPRIPDEQTPLSFSRKIMGFFIFVIFAISFIPDPIKGYNLVDLLKQLKF